MIEALGYNELAKDEDLNKKICISLQKHLDILKIDDLEDYYTIESINNACEKLLSFRNGDLESNEDDMLSQVFSMKKCDNKEYEKLKIVMTYLYDFKSEYYKCCKKYILHILKQDEEFVSKCMELIEKFAQNAGDVENNLFEIDNINKLDSISDNFDNSSIARIKYFGKKDTMIDILKEYKEILFAIELEKKLEKESFYKRVESVENIDENIPDKNFLEFLVNKTNIDEDKLIDLMEHISNFFIDKEYIEDYVFKSKNVERIQKMIKGCIRSKSFNQEFFPNGNLAKSIVEWYETYLTNPSKLEVLEIEELRKEHIKLKKEVEELKEEIDKLLRIKEEQIKKINAQEERLENIWREVDGKEKGRLETERRVAEREERLRLEKDRKEKERQEEERKEKERQEAERKEKERQEEERKEKERQEEEHKEKERQEAERKEKERREEERKKKERLEAKCRENERIETERKERLRLESLDVKIEKKDYEKAIIKSKPTVYNIIKMIDDTYEKYKDNSNDIYDMNQVYRFFRKMILISKAEAYIPTISSDYEEVLSILNRNNLSNLDINEFENLYYKIYRSEYINEKDIINKLDKTLFEMSNGQNTQYSVQEDNHSTKISKSENVSDINKKRIINFMKKKNGPVSMSEISYELSNVSFYTINYILKNLKVVKYSGQYILINEWNIKEAEKKSLLFAVKSLLEANGKEHLKDLYSNMSPIYEDLFKRINVTSYKKLEAVLSELIKNEKDLIMKDSYLVLKKDPDKELEKKENDNIPAIKETPKEIKKVETVHIDRFRDNEIEYRNKFVDFLQSNVNISSGQAAYIMECIENFLITNRVTDKHIFSCKKQMEVEAVYDYSKKSDSFRKALYPKSGLANDILRIYVYYLKYMGIDK